MIAVSESVPLVGRIGAAALPLLVGERGAQVWEPHALFVGQHPPPKLAAQELKPALHGVGTGKGVGMDAGVDDGGGAELELEVELEMGDEGGTLDEVLGTNVVRTVDVLLITPVTD